MKKGTLVIARDGSWSRMIVNGEIKPTGLVDRKKFTIIATGLILPGSENTINQKNDTIARDNESGDVIFIWSGYLTPIPEIKFCQYCGGKISEHGTSCA